MFKLGEEAGKVDTLESTDECIENVAGLTDEGEIEAGEKLKQNAPMGAKVHRRINRRLLT